MKIFAKHQGSILLSLVITLPFIILIAGSYVELATNSFRLARADELHSHAQLAADAGADYALDQINQNGSWNTTNGEVTLTNNSDVKTTYSDTVTSVDQNNKILNVTGKTYWPASNSTANASVKLIINLRAVTSGSSSVIGGVGGLIMSNSAKILGGDVFVNGAVTMSNSSQIGLTTSPVNLTVADQVCPTTPDSTYPRVCNANEAPQPISLSNTAHIYGNVNANNQTSGTGMSNSGLQSGSGVTPSSLPNYDRNSQKAAVATTITGTSASCSSGTATWAANTKITGNVTLSNTCKITVAGNIWVTGNLSVKNSAQLIVADSLGANQPNIMVDGSSGAVFSNSASLTSNASGTGFQIITYYSSASCSPDCSSVSGTDLYNSRNLVTIQLNNTAQGPKTIFYARWSRVQIVNSGQLGALIGQTVELKNSGTITFGTSVSFGNTYWIINGYRRGF